MATFKHDINERNKSNVLKLRMKYGAAGYGVYMMLLERLAAEPQLCAELDYDVLAYDFHESAELIRHVIEDFDFFTVDRDTDTFTHEELYRQLSPKSKQKHMEKAVDQYISRRLSDNEWIQQVARGQSTSPNHIRAALKTSFRQKILESEPRQMSDYLLGVLFTKHLTNK